jgi:aminoglycoside phosphotransferase (APT) family kinase protein
MTSTNVLQPETPLAYGRQAEIFAWGEGRVLKLFLGNWPEAARHEFAISRLAYMQGARTPQPLEVVEKNGRPGIVFEKVEGLSLLQLLGQRPWQARPLARQFAELHHTVHRCKAPELPSARPELEKIIQSRQQLSAPTRSALLKVLSQLPDGDSLLHGDFHPDNVMVTLNGMVIIDWPNAACGCPLADVARTTITLRVGEPVGKISFGLMVITRFLRGVFRSAYLREYFRRSPYLETDLLSWEIVLAAQRIGDRIPGEEAKLVKFIERNLSYI